MNKLVVALALCASALAFTLEATARPGGASKDFAPFDNISRASQALGLSSSQEQQITSIVGDAQLESAVDRERQRQIMTQLRDLATDFDAGTVQALTDELGGIAGRLAYSRIYTMSQVRAVLTEEQLLMLDSAKERVSKRSWRNNRENDSFLENEE